ncbi:MAG: hypothetical protein WBI53_12315 [Paludibacter sp.]
MNLKNRRDDPLERLFYEVETIKNNWSLRQLERAIDSSLAFRTTMSTNILCDDKDDELVRYSAAGMDDRLFVSKYLLKLPDKIILEDFIKRETGII